MFTSLYFTIGISVVFFLIFVCIQFSFFRETRNSSNRYCDFFYRLEDYQIVKEIINGQEIPQLKLVGEQDSDLNKLLSEINNYILKTRGTTDFSVIQNKVERALNMLYEQAEAKLSFPTHLGLMGTFVGVFMGIIMFIPGFSGDGEIRDNSIKNLLLGVIVSMSTSFVGLLLTTCNTAYLSKNQKEVEEDKNEFYNFVQTELMPSLDVSLVVAITKLHETVDEFEPAFEKVISKFQETFDRCTKAFGDSFEKNVTTVANAVDVMGKNMDKINENIELQKSVLSTLKSDEVVRGLEKYVEAANHFVGITQSLNKFEEARRMMLAAAQEAIKLQNDYADSLVVPREVAVRVNQILDRVKIFEENINRLGDKLNDRDILGNDVVNAIRDQVNGIEKKNKIAESYLQKADGELEDLFSEQTKVIKNLNSRYEAAISSHIDGFDQLMNDLTDDVKRRHRQFLDLMEDNLNVEMIHKDFSNLSKLEHLSAIREYAEKLDYLSSINENSSNMYRLDELIGLKDDITKILESVESANRILGSIDYYQKQTSSSDDKGREKGGTPTFIPAPSINEEEMRQMRRDNQELKGSVQSLARGISELVGELKKRPSTPQIVQVPVPTSTPVQTPKPFTSPVSAPMSGAVETSSTTEPVQIPIRNSAPLNYQKVKPVSNNVSHPELKDEEDDSIIYEQPQIQHRSKSSSNDENNEESLEKVGVEEKNEKSGSFFSRLWPFNRRK